MFSSGVFIRVLDEGWRIPFAYTCFILFFWCGSSSVPLKSLGQFTESRLVLFAPQQSFGTSTSNESFMLHAFVHGITRIFEDIRRCATYRHD
ncbi:hypothetical protein DFH29DRAFT_620549 [Suillus ampliporus]|nr:hypothetical protein DFH29DRAFT_620549 [Suillus ampliporus]